MIPFFDYHASAAVLKQRLPEDPQISIPRSRKLNLSQRVCLQIRDWLIGFGQWLSNRANRSDRLAQEYELA